MMIIAPVDVPFRRIVGKFEERRIAEARRQMRVGDDAHAVRPGVRREDEIVLLRHRGDAAQAGDAADQRGVGLQHVEAAFA